MMFKTRGDGLCAALYPLQDHFHLRPFSFKAWLCRFYAFNSAINIPADRVDGHINRISRIIYHGRHMYALNRQKEFFPPTPKMPGFMHITTSEPGVGRTSGIHFNSSIRALEKFHNFRCHVVINEVSYTSWTDVPPRVPDKSRKGAHYASHARDISVMSLPNALQDLMRRWSTLDSLPWDSTGHL